MIEIKAGPELDRAVAEAIGWRFRLADGIYGEILGLFLWHTPEGDRAERGHSPYSTDLNAAFEAAETISRDNEASIEISADYRDELIHFEVTFNWVDGDDTKGWIYPTITGISNDSLLLAICDAILKLKAQS